MGVKTIYLCALLLFKFCLSSPNLWVTESAQFVFVLNFQETNVTLFEKGAAHPHTKKYGDL